MSYKQVKCIEISSEIKPYIVSKRKQKHNNRMSDQTHFNLGHKLSQFRHHCSSINERSIRDVEELIVNCAKVHKNRLRFKAEGQSMNLLKYSLRRYEPLDMMSFIRRERQLINFIQNKSVILNPQSALNQSIIIKKTISRNKTLVPRTEKRNVVSRSENHSYNQNKQESLNSLPKLPEISQQKQKIRPVISKNSQELKFIKSQNFIITELPTNRTILSQKCSVSVQIASLTKIMTFYTIYRLSQQLKIDIYKQKITISSSVYKISGTSADLNEGQQYTVEQLLYGLMLPSGNDAANELAFWSGSFYCPSNSDNKAKCKLFVSKMNVFAKQIEMKNSNFANPHGLPHQEAKSTAFDLSLLCCQCFKIDLFRKIVQTKNYKIIVNNILLSKTRMVEWQNTNKLLRRQGFIGIKTGITVTAGPCLASAFSFRDKIYISILLRAPKISGRFKQTRQLLHWVLHKLYPEMSENEKLLVNSLKHKNEILDSDNSEDESKFLYNRNNSKQYKKRCQILDYEL